MHKGSCLCGAVRFEISGALEPATACHCTQCRKWTGHHEAGTGAPRDQVTILGEEHVTWYHSSEKVRRGFCDTCGSSLFWDPIHKDWTGISMGAFDTPTEKKLTMHIFVSEKGDYYEIADGLPQNQR